MLLLSPKKQRTLMLKKENQPEFTVIKEALAFFFIKFKQMVNLS